jgi:NADH-quinone oxidoreductase subunit E
MITEATKARFAREVAKYPADQKQSAVMACLAIVQQEQGYVSAESEAVIADYLGMPQIAVHEVTTFYNMYNQQPVGKYKLNVCTNLPCQLRDGGKGAAASGAEAGCFHGRNDARWHVHPAAVRVPGRLCRCTRDAGERSHMCSFMDNDKLDQLVDGLRAAEGKQ